MFQCLVRSSAISIEVVSRCGREKTKERVKGMRWEGDDERKRKKFLCGLLSKTWA